MFLSTVHAGAEEINVSGQLLYHYWYNDAEALCKNSL